MQIIIGIACVRRDAQVRAKPTVSRLPSAGYGSSGPGRCRPPWTAQYAMWPHIVRRKTYCRRPLPQPHRPISAVWLSVACGVAHRDRCDGGIPAAVARAVAGSCASAEPGASAQASVQVLGLSWRTTSTTSAAIDMETCMLGWRVLRCYGMGFAAERRFDGWSRVSAVWPPLATAGGRLAAPRRASRAAAPVEA